MRTRRISYVVPTPPHPPPQLTLPPAGVPRHGQTRPLLIPAAKHSPERSDKTATRPSHPQHRLAVSALALDASTQLADRSTPEGILYTSGRDGLVAAWELGVSMRRRAPRARERKRHWEALTGWDDDDEESSDEEVEEDGLDGIVRPPRQKKTTPAVDESGWTYEQRWEAASEELQPARFRQSMQLHTDWVNDVVLCNMNQTIVSASSDGTVRTYNPHSTDAPSIVGSHGDYARCLAYAAGPRWVASGSFDRTVKLWDVSRATSGNDGAELATLSLGDADPKASIYAVATDPAGTLVAAGGPERVVRVWDPRVASGVGTSGEARCLSALRGHTDNIRAILVSEDGRYVLTGSSDASIKLWSLPMRRCIHTFSVHSDSVWALHSTHPQLHTFFSGDRAGWICRTDVTQPAPSSSSVSPSETFSQPRSTTGPVFPRNSIVGTPNKTRKNAHNEMELSDAYCVVIGRAGWDSQAGNGANSHKHNETAHGITTLTAMDDTWVWVASGDSSVQRWRGVAAARGMANNWGSRGTKSMAGATSANTVLHRTGSERTGSPKPGMHPHESRHSQSSAGLATVHASSGVGRKRISIDSSRFDSALHIQTHVEGEVALVSIPARVPSASTPPAFPSSTSPTAQTVQVPYTSLIRLAEPNPFQLQQRDGETATLYSHSGMSVHRNAHREDLAMGSGFFGLPPTSPVTSLYTAPALNHTSSLPLVPSSGPPVLSHTHSNPTPSQPAPSTLPIASDISDVSPLWTEPADEISGSHGLVRSVVLNDRMHALSVDTRGEVAIWDVVRGLCRGVFDLESVYDRHKLSPREALDLVRDRIEGEAMTPAWASVDTRVGDLTVHLIEPRCFDAEVYADEIEWLDPRVMGAENGEESESRLNLGKWVLGNLFAEYVRAELALSAELAAATPRNTAYGLPAASSLPPGAEGGSIPGSPKIMPGSPRIAPATPLLGGTRTPRATHVSLTGRPTHIPLPVRARSGSEASIGGIVLGMMTPSGIGLGSATLAPTMSPAILPNDEVTATLAPNLNILSPIRELQTSDLDQQTPSANPVGTSGGPGDYFTSVKLGKEKEGVAASGTDPSTPGVPTAPPTPGGSGLMGRLKSLGKAGKRGAATPGGTVPSGVTGGDGVAPEVEVEEFKDPERTRHLNLVSSLLSNPLTPPGPHEVPPLSFPPNTAITISEATADASGWTAVFAGSTGTLGVEVEALEMAIPGWLLEYLLAGRLSVPANGAAAQKIGFMLLPWKGAKEVLPELVGSQSRLTASRFLRVSKVVTYVHDKLQSHAVMGTTEERRSQESVGWAGAGMAGPEYEILCNEQVLSTGATLAAVRQYVWRNAGELVMHYRIKET